MHQEYPVTRRRLLAGGAALGAAGLFARAGIHEASAQDSAALSGFPELTITITDQGLEVGSNSVPAGYVLLTVTNNSQNPNGAGVLGPGPGQTMADLQAAAATPVPNDAFPPFFYTAAIPGGPGTVPPGSSAQAVIQLTPGDWVVITQGEESPAFFSATEGSPAAAAEPAAAVTVFEADFVFGGLDAPIPAGQQIWKVVNTGSQPHMLVLAGVPAGTTREQVMQTIENPEGASPVPGGLTESDYSDKGGVILQSTGTTVWPLLDLPAGRYVAACFVTDPNNGKPHAMEGMVTLFDTGSASATPTG